MEYTFYRLTEVSFYHEVVKKAEVNCTEDNYEHPVAFTPLELTLFCWKGQTSIFDEFQTKNP